MSKNIIIGKILSPHGVKGMCHLLSYAQNPKDIFNYEVFDNQQNIIKLKFIRNSAKSTNGDIFIAIVNDIKDRNEISKLTNNEIFLNRESLPETKEGEYYFSDLEGLKVLDQSSKEVGVVSCVADFGAGTLLEVRFLGKKIDNSQFLPFNDNCVIEVNLKKHFIKLNIKDYQ